MFGVCMNELEIWWVGVWVFLFGIILFPHTHAHRKALLFGYEESIISLRFVPTKVWAQQPAASHSEGYHPPSLIICSPACSEHHKPSSLGNMVVRELALQGCDTNPTLAMHVSEGSRSLYIWKAVPLAARLRELSVLRKLTSAIRSTQRVVYFVGYKALSTPIKDGY